MTKTEAIVRAERIESCILLIRGQKVMLDSDLAELYGVSAGALTRAVRRNSDRFPSDFMFRLNKAEVANLRSQLAPQVSGADVTSMTGREGPSAELTTVLSSSCNPGDTAFVEPGMEFTLGQNLVLLRADGSKLYPPFLRWWEQIGKFINVGAVFDSLKCVDIPNLNIYTRAGPERLREANSKIVSILLPTGTA